jgi:hypothetical protein
VVEQTGWSRTTRHIKEWTAGLGYAFEAAKEGMEWLTKLRMTKKVPGNPLAWEWASKAVQDAMRVPEWMEYGEWVRELVFSDTEAGGYLKRYLVEQGSVCRASQRSKKGRRAWTWKRRASGPSASGGCGPSHQQRGGMVWMACTAESPGFATFGRRSSTASQGGKCSGRSTTGNETAQQCTVWKKSASWGCRWRGTVGGCCLAHSRGR